MTYDERRAKDLISMEEAHRMVNQRYGIWPEFNIKTETLVLLKRIGRFIRILSPLRFPPIRYKDRWYDRMISS